jgi:HAE1 family hydrophobic/amphiphilic exporter-1/multidrug efflux pump
MRLWIDPIKLASYGLTVAEVRTALGKQNVELPSGKLTGANTELTVKLLLTAEEFNNIIIRSEGGKMCLSDIGSAVLGPENIETKLSQSVTFNRTSNSSRPGATI